MNHRLSIGDTSFHVLREGEGDPLVLVHGFPLDHQMWLDVIPSLAEHFLVIAPDLRGFGSSDGYVESASMELLADDLLNILSALEITKPVHYCGLSMGGYVGWQMWRKYRERLASLIQLDTRALADDEVQARARRQNALQLLSSGMSEVPEVMIPKLLGKVTQQDKPQVGQTLSAMITRQDPRAAAAAQRGMAERVDATPWLPEIDLPTLVICGEEDVISPPQEMQAFAAQIRGAKFVEIPSAGHMTPMEDPKATAEAIQSFIAGEA